LVDHVFPPIPVRQWVLSVRKRLRWYLEREQKQKAVSAVQSHLQRVDDPFYLVMTIRNGAPFQRTGGDPICGKRNLQEAVSRWLIRRPLKKNAIAMKELIVLPHLCPKRLYLVPDSPFERANRLIFK
jgi:hypothetical protein